MAVNERTWDKAERTVYYELRDPPRPNGGPLPTVKVPVLLPFSKVVIDGIEYIEPNAYRPTPIPPPEGGGAHMLPTEGIVTGVEYRERSQGVHGGTATGETPADVVLHSFGWV